MRNNYILICKAILEKSKGKDFRPLLRKWVKLFEDTGVVGWNRDEFLECMIECKFILENRIKK